MISVEEALNTILAQVKPLEAETVPILKALGRVLSEGVVSTTDIPSFRNSAMDGYALRAADIRGASPEKPIRLDVVEEVPAGYVPHASLDAGKAARIMTGAPVPEGADAVLMVEYTQSEDTAVTVMREVREGENIRLAGEDVKASQVVLQKGKVVTPADIGLLAAIGEVRAKVKRQPSVSILATGDEIVDVSEPLTIGKVRNSNSYALAAQVMSLGATPKIVGIARDRADEMEERIKLGLRGDVLLTTGGVSVGDFDLVKGVLQNLGEIILWKVAMKPGKPLAFGMIDGKLVFGLPGNPTSAMVTFEQFVRPALLKMAGRKKLKKAEVEAVLAQDIDKKPGRRYFLRVVVEKRGDQYYAALAGPQGSGILKSMSLANGLLVLSEETTEKKKGDLVSVQMIEWPEME